MKQRQFSSELTAWARGKRNKTLGGLINEFSKDAFAIVILLLMAVPALPVPTGGITHIFEIITMLLALELLAGRATIWLPRRWRSKSLSSFSGGKVFGKLVAVIRWIERFSRPRGARIMNSRYVLPLIGILVLLFALAAFLAPPFSGLDTLPALGAVVLALALIFSDVALLVAGIVIGGTGIALIFVLGSALYKLF